MHILCSMNFCRVKTKTNFYLLTTLFHSLRTTIHTLYITTLMCMHVLLMRQIVDNDHQIIVLESGSSLETHML